MGGGGGGGGGEVKKHNGKVCLAGMPSVAASASVIKTKLNFRLVLQ